MGEVRGRRLGDDEAPRGHVESAGERLVRDLAIKQTKKETSLEEQLSAGRTFVSSGVQSGIDSHGIVDRRLFETLSELQEDTRSTEGREPDVVELQERTGLSREFLEEQLSVKPNSKFAKLYKFALENRVRGEVGEKLIDRLPDHPINNLKNIEKDFVDSLGKNEEKALNHGKIVAKRTVEPNSKPTTVPNDDLEEVRDESSKQKRKIRRRKKKKDTGSTSPTKDSAMTDTSSEVRILPTTSTESPPKFEKEVLEPRARPSLWDVKNMKAFCRPDQPGCAPQKKYTIKDGKIIEIRDDT